MQGTSLSSFYHIFISISCGDDHIALLFVFIQLIKTSHSFQHPLPDTEREFGDREVGWLRREGRAGPVGGAGSGDLGGGRNGGEENM